MTQSTTENLNYEECFRVIGRILDAEPAFHLSLLEIDDEITLRFYSAQFATRAKTIHLTHDRLRDLSIYQSGARGTGQRRVRHKGLWSKYPEGHQEFFRALGYALDQDCAKNVVVDELSDEVRISYMRPDARDAVRCEKCQVVLRERDILTLVESSRQRRSMSLSLLTGGAAIREEARPH